ncbi:MAG: site-2 protease family protein [Candidatus Omnitrophica bacterium]|nr:site-2 protease family protein [Candidatus Omnitrophota bacterium]MBU1996319.1 site-2 protease family protein [Candidatus Omnitrophota bacterium]MBU4332881.1 site-2 protease family protein [Candidatus Omnitrophota bacterium]
MLIEIFSILVVLFFSIILHECAHGWVANKLGDPTAKLAGRLTLNPLKHVDMVGTVIIPGILLTLRMLGHDTFVFGWAKPVPVMFSRLKNPKRDMIWVGLSGPAINIAIAVLLSRIFIVGLPNAMEALIEIAIYMNILLAVFNLIPIPPLDGSRILMGLLPDKIAMKYASVERYGILIVFGLLYLGAFKIIVLPIILVVGKILGVDF